MGGRNVIGSHHSPPEVEEDGEGDEERGDGQGVAHDGHVVQDEDRLWRDTTTSSHHTPSTQQTFD